MALAPILLARRGLTGERDPSRLVTGDLIVARNVGYSTGNLVEKEGGSAKINATALSGAPAVMAGFDWWPTPSIQRRIIATADGRLYRDDMSGAYATRLKGGLGTDRITHFVEGGAESAGRSKKLFAFNGNDPVQVLSADGLTTTAIATPPSDWTGINQPAFAFPFRNVMVAGGNANFLSQLYGSLSTDHEDYNSAGTWTLPVYPGQGQRLVAGMQAFGRAWVWKFPRGVYWIDDAAATISGWFMKEASLQYGAAPTPHAVVQIDDAIVAFVSNTGSIVLMQESSGSLTGATFTDLTKALNLRQLVRDNFNLARLDRVQARWYDERKQLHVVYAGLGAMREDRRLVVDFNEERTRVEISTKDVNPALWLEQDQQIPRLRAGDDAGHTWRLDQLNRHVGGVVYPMVIQTAATDFSDINPAYMGLKLLHALHLEFEPTGDFDVAVQILVDGRDKGTVAFNMGGEGTTLPFTLPATLGGEALRRRTRAIVGEGHYLSLKIQEDGANNPKLSRAWAEFTMAGVDR